MNKAPCINCKKRKLKCHSTCEEYKEWLKSRSKQASEEIYYYYVDRRRK